MARRLIAAAALALGAACSQASLPVPTEADVARLAPVWPEASTAELAEGRRLYLGRCGSCHRPYHPNEHTASQWAVEVPEMKERARLAPADAERVLRYLQAYAQDAERTSAN